MHAHVLGGEGSGRVGEHGVNHEAHVVFNVCHPHDSLGLAGEDYDMSAVRAGLLLNFAVS